MKEVQKVWAELAAQEKKSQKQELASDVFGNLKRRYDKANGKVSGIKQEIKTVANHLKSIAKAVKASIKGCIMSLDSAYDSLKNRKIIFNCGMTPNIKEKPRNRKSTKRGKKRMYSDAIYQERFRTVERAFAWEDKFKRLLLRFEHKSINHLGMKLLGYTLLNLRHFV